MQKRHIAPKIQGFWKALLIRCIGSSKYFWISDSKKLLTICKHAHKQLMPSQVVAHLMLITTHRKTIKPVLRLTSIKSIAKVFTEITCWTWDQAISTPAKNATTLGASQFPQRESGHWNWSNLNFRAFSLSLSNHCLASCQNYAIRKMGVLCHWLALVKNHLHSLGHPSTSIVLFPSQLHFVG